MSYGYIGQRETCNCQSRINDLEYRLGCLQTQLDGLKRDLEREESDRTDAVRSVRTDLSDLYTEMPGRS